MKPSRRSQWKPLLFMTVVLVACVLASFLLSGKTQARKEFVSKVANGPCYHFTLAPDWQLLKNAPDPLPGMLEGYTFTAPPPNPIREWIAQRLSPQVAPSKSFQRPIISLQAFTAKGTPGIILFRDGYPIPSLNSVGRILTQRHLRINGCPATIVKQETSFAGATYRATFLLICTPDFSSAYAVNSVADRRYSNEADREIDVIVSSFRVEKFSSPRDLKR